MNIEKLDIGNLTEKDWIELHDFTAELFSELYPKEPPVTLDYSKRVFTGSSESHVREHYVIKDGNKIIADSKLWYIKPSSDTKESDVDNVNIDIRVRREYRRKKLATELLTYLLENEILERHVKVNLSADRSPGYEFCESFDGEITTEGFPCSLWFEQTDWKNIEKMNNQAKNRSEEISVSISEGINAEDEPAYFDIFCDMYEELSKYRKDYSFNREFTKKQMIASRQKKKIEGETFYCLGKR
ncbi:MAG: GNAT family N-acetyltransferase [Caldisericia bacterium]